MRHFHANGIYMPSARKSPPAQRTIEPIRGALVELRRLLQRRDLCAIWAEDIGRSGRMDYGELRLLDAVRVAQSRTSDGVTVGELATLLGIDPSRASRQVARAVKKGLVRRQATQSDGRKVVLQITASGAKLQTAGSDLTRARVDLALSGWTAKERDEFAHLFVRFAEGMAPRPSQRRERYGSTR